MAEGRGSECHERRQDAGCVCDGREGGVVAHVAYLLEKGQTRAPPVSTRTAAKQIHLRSTTEEKLTLETAAKQGGFGGVSDFVRTAAMKAAGR